MDPDAAQEMSERDQLWASLRALRPEIDSLAAGNLEPTERQARLILILARVVAAEMDFRLRDAEADAADAGGEAG
jgi:hypothetical protein